MASHGGRSVKYYTLIFYNGPVGGDSVMKRLDEPAVGSVIEYEYNVAGGGKRKAPYRVAAINGQTIKLLWVQR